MAWDFSTEPEFQKKLDWVEASLADDMARAFPTGS